MVNQFKEKYSFEKRKSESDKVSQKYKDRSPIIVQRHHSSDLPNVEKCKYLVPKDMTMSQFTFVIRKGIQLDASQTIFITVNNGLVIGSRVISEVYEEHKDEDGFLYITYTNENVFG